MDYALTKFAIIWRTKTYKLDMPSAVLILRGWAQGKKKKNQQPEVKILGDYLPLFLSSCAFHESKKKKKEGSQVKPEVAHPWILSL